MSDPQPITVSTEPAILTKAVLADLRRPFALDAIRWKIQAGRKDDPSKALAVFYMDARMVVARLDHVAGPGGWHDSYRPLLENHPQAFMATHFPVECRLTVLGVTKADVGVYQRAKEDELAIKAAYSDALKRAAVRFQIGAFLYALPKVWAPARVANGKPVAFTPEGDKQLRSTYERWLKKNPFGDVLDHGFATDDPDDPAYGSEGDSASELATTGNGAGASEPAGRPRMISQPQRNKMWALAGELRLTEEQVRSIVAVVVNTADACESTKAIPTVKYQDVLRSMEAVAKDFEEGGSMYVDKMAAWRELNPMLATILGNAVALNVGAGGDAD